MAVNAWNLATATFLDDLAQREARRRQATLDAQRAAEMQADREMRERQIQLSTKQVEASIANQQADNDRLNAEQIRRANAEASAAKKAARDEEERAALMAMYRTATDPAGRQQAADNLALRGVRVADQAPKVPGSLAEALIAKGMDPDAAYREEMRLKTDEQIRQSRGSRAPSGDAPAFRDNPRLPQGTKSWIDSIAQRGALPDQARRELSAGWGQQRQAHPNAELAEALKYLDTLYPDGAPAFRPEADGVIPAPTAPAATVGAATPDDQAAIAALTAAGAPITPANIAAAKAQLAAAGGR